MLFFSTCIALLGILATSAARKPPTRPQIATKPAIPVPTSPAQLDRLRDLAALMPPVQQTLDDQMPDQRNLKTVTDYTSFSDSPFSNIKATRASPLRIMVIGDSMTQGRQGDWTWRYRLWNWLYNQKIQVDFVGPYVGTVDMRAPKPPTPPVLYKQKATPEPANFDGGYAHGTNPAFDSGHYSAWGRAAAYITGDMPAIAKTYKADLTLIMLGFNDFGWLGSSPSSLLNNIQSLVNSSRAANPNMKFVLANVPMRTSIGRQDLPVNVEAYNSLLNSTAPQWSTSNSPVAVAHLREIYSCELDACPASYDGLHPNALGEWQIALAFSQAMVKVLGIGKTPVKIPTSVASRELPVPSNFLVQTTPYGVTATWNPVWGAYAYDIQSRIVNATSWTVGKLDANRYDQMWAQDGATYEMQVRATAAGAVGPWTNVKSAIARPQLAPAPANVRTLATATGMNISWTPPTGPYTNSIVEYNVMYYDLDLPGQFLAGAAFQNSPATIDGLNYAHRYSVQIEIWNANGRGFPKFFPNVKVGYGAPLAPKNLVIKPTDGATIIYTWNPDPAAAGYNVYLRNIPSGKPSSFARANVLITCQVDTYLLPGVWNYEFCITAFNGNAESPKTCMIPSKPVGQALPMPVCPT